MSRERSTLAIQGGEFRYYLATLKESVFGFDLPKPDIATEQAANPWKSYSIDGLREYLAALFSNFIGIYKFIVETNFPSVSFRMNLYNQLPAQLILLMNPSSDSVRIFALPEEEEMGLKIIQTTASNPDVVSDGKLTIDQLPYDVFVHKAFRQYKRYRTNSYPVDRLMPLKDLFGEAPVNGLVYSWLHSELADLFQIP